MYVPDPVTDDPTAYTADLDLPAHCIPAFPSVDHKQVKVLADKLQQALGQRIDIVFADEGFGPTTADLLLQMKSKGVIDIHSYGKITAMYAAENGCNKIDPSVRIEVVDVSTQRLVGQLSLLARYLVEVNSLDLVQA